MKRLAYLAAVCFFAACAPLAATPIDDWQVFEGAVRDGSIARPEAELKLAPLVDAVSSYIIQNYDLAAGAWTFPLADCRPSSLDSHDYKPAIRYGPQKIKGYDFFDGNRHGGHPAYDIFIADKDRDSLDDRTGKPAPARAMADAVVLSVHAGWEAGSPLRGGNYVWLYSPPQNKFFYYAHLAEVLVAPGQLVRAGETVGTVGRTGVLAAQKRSPTHVHLMVLEYRNGRLEPFNYLKRLAVRRKK